MAIGAVFRGLAIAVIGASACMQSHDGTVELRKDECATCHLPDFEETRAPAHRPSGFPQTCADCHQTTHWQPALGLHPENKFPIAAGVHKVACLDCHIDFGVSAKKGENTTCITEACHGVRAMDATHSEKEAASYTALRGTSDHFCLDSRCHPDGRKE